MRPKQQRHNAQLPVPAGQLACTEASLKQLTAVSQACASNHLQPEEDLVNHNISIFNVSYNLLT